MSLEDEKAQVWAAIHYNGDRITELREGIQAVVRDAVKDAMPVALLSSDEHAWVKLAIAREAQSIKFRQAVIEKTLLGLIWACLVGLALVAKEYAQAHGMWKP